MRKGGWREKERERERERERETADWKEMTSRNKVLASSFKELMYN
jgi:hypothetical protein